MRRVGQVIDVRPERIDDYERLHATPWPGVLAAIHRANIRNYTIYRHGTRLFASFEYVGDDYAADMAGDGGRPRDQGMVDADGSDAAAARGSTTRELVDDDPRGIPHGLTRPQSLTGAPLSADS